MMAPVPTTHVAAPGRDRLRRGGEDEHARGHDPPRPASLRSERDRERRLLRCAEGRGAGPEGRAEPVRRLRPTPERRQARAVREEGERGDGVPGRAGGASEVSVPLSDWILTNSLRTALAHSARTPTRMPAVRFQIAHEPRCGAP